MLATWGHKNKSKCSFPHYMRQVRLLLQLLLLLLLLLFPQLLLPLFLIQLSIIYTTIVINATVNRAKVCSSSNNNTRNDKIFKKSIKSWNINKIPHIRKTIFYMRFTIIPIFCVSMLYWEWIDHANEII